MKACLPAAMRRRIAEKNLKLYNIDAVDQAIALLEEIQYLPSWKDASDPVQERTEEPDFVQNVMRPALAQKGDDLPVSAFDPAGIFPVATSRFEKRGVAIYVPQWVKENCIQCNQCAFVCSHSACDALLCKQG